MDETDHVRLTLRPLPDPVPADVRLRRALKALLRVYGFRCLLIEGVMTEHQFDARLSQIEAEYQRRREAADAYRDQELARLFEKSGWSQERIAGKMGKSTMWVCYRLRLAAFLAYTTGLKPNSPAENLTERRFRRCWGLTDRKAPERRRFAQVAELLARAPGDNPAVHPNLVNKPGIRQAVAEACRDLGGWHNVGQLAGRLEARIPGITTKAVGTALKGLQRKPPKGFAVESRHIGRIHQYRLVPRAEVGADAPELIAQVRPVLSEIKAELKKSSAAMSTTFLLERVAYIEKVLSHLRESAPAV